MEVKLRIAHNRWLNIIASACFMFLSISLLIAHQYPAIGYELDIYESTPVLTWVFLILAMVGGGGIIYYQVVTNGYETCRIWMVGLSILILSRFALVLVPYIRGYVGWSGDYMGYQAATNDIIYTGYFTYNDYYPVCHTLIAQVAGLTGISIYLVTTIGTAFMSVIFIMSAYLLAKVLNLNRGHQMLASLLAGIVLIAGTYNVIMTTYGWSVLMMPMVFYFYLSKRTISYTLGLLILVILYPFFHPLSCLLLILALIIMEMAKWLLPVVLNPTADAKISIYDAKLRAPIILIASVIFLTWILSKTMFNPNIRLLMEVINAPSMSDKFIHLQESVSKLKIYGFDFVILLSKMFGYDIILIILSLIAIMLILRQVQYHNRINELKGILSIACAFIFYGLLYAAYLMGLPGMQPFGQGQWDQRYLGLMMIFTPLLAALTLYNLSALPNYKKYTYVSIICLLATCSILSIASIFDSPYTMRPSLQITQMDMTATRWFVNKKDTNVICAVIKSSPGNTAMGFMSAAEMSSRLDLRAVQFQDHLGYDEYATIGAQYSSDKYSMIGKKDRIIYSTVWEAVGRHTKNDFAKLEEDHTVNKLYTNNEIDIYYVRAAMLRP
jgi:hypothetical protein